MYHFEPTIAPDTYESVRAARNRFLSELTKLIQTLDPSDQTLLHLVFVEDLDISTVAQMLGLEEKTAAYALARSLKVLDRKGGYRHTPD
jgi:DNA-directed RNA polymerase specialized sigma24 family protein